MDFLIKKEDAEKIAALIQTIPSSVGIPIMDILRNLKPCNNSSIDDKSNG